MTFLFTLFLTQISCTFITCITYSCLSNATCGCSLNSAILTKIIGGEEAIGNTWGWVVSIRFRNNHICGGSLISPDLVLTATHCLNTISPISSLTVTAGSKYLSEVNQRKTVSKIFIHRNYQSKTYTNDIAFIQLSSPFNINDRSLALICLSSNLTESLLENTTVVAIGWGVLSSVDKVPSNTLQQVSLILIGNTDPVCRRSIKNTDVQFCAGVEGGGKDTCQGDSGGPLMTFVNQQWYIVGITSYGVGCALSSYAGVYTRVSVYERWIDCFLEKDQTCIEQMFVLRNSVSFITTSFYRNTFVIFLFLYKLNF